MTETDPKKPRPIGARKGPKPKIRDAGEIPVHHGFIKSFDGTRLFYSSEGTGKPILFCYGLICSSLHWTYQIQFFRNSYKAIWPDYRGHHNSDVPANLSTLTVENLARDLHALLDELKIDSTILMGHSMGVNVVLEAYRQNPGRVEGLVLANGTAKAPLETMFHVNAFERLFDILKIVYKFSPELVRKVWSLQKNNPIAQSLIAMAGFNPHLTPKEDIDLYLKQVSEMDPVILIKLIEDYNHSDASAWLHTIDKPVLIIAGGDDHIIPLDQQQRMHQLIPDSQLEIIKHGSHCPQMDLPDLVNLKIKNWLDQLGY